MSTKSTTRSTIRERAVSWAKDLAVLVAALSLMLTGAKVVFSPWVDPFLQLPSTIHQLDQTVQQLQFRVNTFEEPQLINFLGNGMILGPRSGVAGDVIVVVYALRRNASCDTNILIRYADVDRGQTITINEIKSNKAPVTDAFIFFKVDLVIPERLRPGVYSYFPEIIPQECGVYRPFTPPPSQFFEVLDTPL